MTEIPRPLLRKRSDLAHELQEAEAKTEAARAKLQTLDSTIQLLAPGWRPPAGLAPKRPARASGADTQSGFARDSVRVLISAGAPLTSSEIREAIAKAKSLALAKRTDRKRLTSAVLPALKRARRRSSSSSTLTTSAYCAGAFGGSGAS